MGSLAWRRVLGLALPVLLPVALLPLFNWAVLAYIENGSDSGEDTSLWGLMYLAYLPVLALALAGLVLWLVAMLSTGPAAVWRALYVTCAWVAVVQTALWMPAFGGYGWRPVLIAAACVPVAAIVAFVQTRLRRTPGWREVSAPDAA